MLSNLLDYIPDGVFTVDAEWRVTFFNRAAEQITGIKRAEAVGRRCCDVFRASICENACALKQTLSTNRPVVNKVVYIIDARGQKIPISISTAALKDERGRIVGGVESFRDLRVVEELHRELQQQNSFSDIIGRSAAMRQIFELLPADCRERERGAHRRAPAGRARSCLPAPCTICRGGGRRSSWPSIAGRCRTTCWNRSCSATKRAHLPTRGATSRAGSRWPRAGTIFLDEIGDISPAMQARLLRVLQERVYEPLGGVEPVKADVRVIAATNKNLSKLVEQGRFREDLFYRIHVIRLELPSLRDRREDIPLLIDHFIARFNRLKGKDIAGVSDAVLARLMEHDFPGNVRELENIIEHAFVLCRGGVIELKHLPPPLRGGALGEALRLGKAVTLESMEKLLITDALRRNGGNHQKAAKELGINPSTLFRKLKAYRLAKKA